MIESTNEVLTLISKAKIEILNYLKFDNEIMNLDRCLEYLDQAIEKLINVPRGT